MIGNRRYRWYSQSPNAPISLRTEAVRRTGGINGIDSHFNRTAVPFLKPTGQESPDASSRCTAIRWYVRQLRPSSSGQRDIVGDHIEKLTCRWQTAVVNIKRNLRAIRRPSLIWKLLSICGR